MGTKWSPEKLANHRGMLGKAHSSDTRATIGAAQSKRPHKEQEGFRPGHGSFSGTEETQFKKGFIPWNKGIGKGTEPAKRKLSTYRANASRQHRAFEVSLEQMREFLSSSCIYCGEQATGIDRIDNTQGYIEGNMVACCEVCNHMKWNLTRDEFLAKCQQITAVTGYEI